MKYNDVKITIDPNVFIETSVIHPPLTIEYLETEFVRVTLMEPLATPSSMAAAKRMIIDEIEKLLESDKTRKSWLMDLMSKKRSGDDSTNE